MNLTRADFIEGETYYNNDGEWVLYEDVEHLISKEKKMSVVANIILITIPSDGGDCYNVNSNPNVDKLNQKIKATYENYGFNKVSQYAGGNRNMECDIFICAIGCVDINELIGMIKSINWEFPKEVQLMIKNEDDNRFKNYKLGL